LKLLKFSEFVNESIESLQLKAETYKNTLVHLDRLMTMGLITDSQAQSGIRAAKKALYSLIKSETPGRIDFNDLELIKALSNATGDLALNALTSEGAEQLRSQGLYMVSSLTQLANGTLVWSLDKNFQRGTGWGLGFFPGSKKIRRITPKGINLGLWHRQVGSMDQTITGFKNVMSVSEFYDTAMKWASKHIDFDQVKLYPEETATKYYKKKPNDPASRSELDDIFTRSQDLEFKSRDAKLLGDTVKNLELKIESLKLMIQYYRVKGDESDLFRISELENHMRVAMAKLSKEEGLRK